jgi:hypothetical protein
LKNASPIESAKAVIAKYFITKFLLAPDWTEAGAQKSENLSPAM